MKKKYRHVRPNIPASPAPKPFKIAPDFAYDSIAYNKYRIPTEKEIRAIYGPVKTLGAPHAEADNMAMAMDAMLDSCGFYGLIQHAYQLGQPPQGNGFIGYAALSELKPNGLISACVETVADDMLRAWIDIKQEEDADKQEEDADKQDIDIPKAVEDRFKELKLQKVFREATAMTQYFGGCLIFINTGNLDPDVLKTPLNISDKSAELGQGRLHGFKVVEPINVFPGTYNSINPLRDDYFEPDWWWVMGIQVHASRFIKITSGDVPVLLRPSYNFFGVPHAQILWDYVLHFQKDRVATSRALSKYSDYVFKEGGLRDAMMAPDGTSQIDRRVAIMARYRSNDGITVIDKDEEDIVKVESSLGGLVDIAKQSLNYICCINRTPAEKLLGEPPPGFNSTGESSIKNYNKHISAQQEKILKDGIERALQIVQLDLFGKIDQSITFEFCKLDENDRQIESGIKKANTDTLAALVMADIITAEGARATVLANPDEYLVGLNDGIEADEAAIEAAAEGDLEEYGIPATIAGGEESPAVAGAETPDESVQNMGMNGAQVTALQGIVMAVANGELPRDSGIYMIVSAFGITPEEAEKIVGAAGADFVSSKNSAMAEPSVVDTGTPEQAEAIREMQAQRENPTKKEMIAEVRL